MDCPHCKQELKPTERQGIEIDYCPNCRGIWLDRGELDKLLDRSTAMMPTQASPWISGKPCTIRAGVGAPGSAT